MREIKTGDNTRELHTDDDIFLLSYGVPVAAFVEGIGYIRTEEFFSKATSKHINNWLRDNGALDRAMKIPQKGMEELISRARN